MRHDNIRDFLAGLLNVVQNDVETEPHLQEVVGGTSTDMGNTADQARLDIRAKSFWRTGQDAYFDVRVTNPVSTTAMKRTLNAVYDSNEKEKKKKCTIIES